MQLKSYSLNKIANGGNSEGRDVNFAQTEVNNYSPTKGKSIEQDKFAPQVLALALPQHTLADELTQATIQADETSELKVDKNIGQTSLRSITSTMQLLRTISNSDEEYVVISNRPGLIWDSHLLKRIENEINFVEKLELPWLCLLADGKDAQGNIFFSAHFDYEPTLTPSRGRLPVVQTVGTLVIIKMSRYRDLDLRHAARNDVTTFINNLIIVGYSRGLGSYFSSYLFPCLAEHRGLIYKPLEDQLVSMDVSGYLESLETAPLFPAEIKRAELLGDWIAEVQASYSFKRRFSFVIRTLFRRKYLLERCLISIEYLRSSLNLEAEIVLSTDITFDKFEPDFEKLKSDFPNLEFRIADGRTEHGHSRVRNLIAGLKATTGDRVCIIDDDDYYTPQAVKFFEQACMFGRDEILIFDTQIIVERWTLGGVKPHRQILAYQNLFVANEWTTTLKGTNMIPFCGVIHPGDFVRQIADEYVFDFDYSEDFLFHIHCFTHSVRPIIRVEDGIGAYQSHREKEDNVSTVKDRQKWTTDTGNGLFQLLFEQGRTFDLVSSGTASAHIDGSMDTLAALRAEVESARKGQQQATKQLAELVRHSTTSNIQRNSKEKRKRMAVSWRGFATHVQSLVSRIAIQARGRD